MERIPHTRSEQEQLVQLGALITENIKIITEEWDKERNTDLAPSDVIRDSPKILPSRRLHQAQRTILAASGSLTELIAEPYNRLQEFASEIWEARALAVAVERRIADMLDEAGEKGLDTGTLSKKTGVEAAKLSRVMRCLCTNHIFRQTGDDRFANNRISSALVHNEDFRSYLLVFAINFVPAMERFPKYLLGPKGSSYNVAETALTEALGTEKSYWDWLAERVRPEHISNGTYSSVPDPGAWGHLKVDGDGLVKRPEMEIFSIGMVGGGKVNGSSLPFDYPWDELPTGSTIVDVGGGMGGFILQLLQSFPHFKCVIQDRPEIIAEAEGEFWPKHGAKFLNSGHVVLQVYDFFTPNPIKGAEIYWLRGIMHDWPDEHCVTILEVLKEALSDTSRVLICDQVMNTTNGSEEMESAPSPLPANYGYYSRYHHERDLNLMGTINGIERTPRELKVLIEKAGLKMVKVYDTRCVFGIVEVTK